MALRIRRILRAFPFHFSYQYTQNIYSLGSKVGASIQPSAVWQYNSAHKTASQAKENFSELWYTTDNIVFILFYPGGLYLMSLIPASWPEYSFIVPQIYTRSGVRLVGLGNYAPAGTITNEFFAHISTKLG